MVLIRVASLFLKITPIPALRPNPCPQFEPPGFRPERMDFVAHLGQSGHFEMSEAFPSPFRGSKRAPEAFYEAAALSPAQPRAPRRGGPAGDLRGLFPYAGTKKSPPPGDPGSRESEIYNYFPASFLYMARRAAASSSFFLNRLAAASGNCLSRLA